MIKLFRIKIYSKIINVFIMLNKKIAFINQFFIG